MDRRDLPPTYVCLPAAATVTSDTRPMQVSGSALYCLNLFLDELLRVALSASTDLQTDQFKAAFLANVFPNALGKDAALEAELGMREWRRIGGAAKEKVAGFGMARDRNGKRENGDGGGDIVANHFGELRVWVEELGELGKRWRGVGGSQASSTTGGFDRAAMREGNIASLPGSLPSIVSTVASRLDSSPEQLSITPSFALYCERIVTFIAEYILQGLATVVVRDPVAATASPSELYAALCEDEILWRFFEGMAVKPLIQNEIQSKNNRHQRHAQKSSSSSTNHSSVSSSTPPSSHVPLSQSSTNSMSPPQTEALRRPSTGTNSTSSTNGAHPSKPHRSNSVLSNPTTGHSRGAKSSRDFEMNEDPNGVLGSSSLPTTPSEGAVGRFRKWSQKSGRGRSGSASTATSNSSPSGNQGAGAGGSQSVGTARRPSGENNGSDGPDMFSASFVSGDDQELTDFEQLMLSGKTMRVSLTPNRLKTMEAHAKDKGQPPPLRSDDSAIPSPSVSEVFPSSPPKPARQWPDASTMPSPPVGLVHTSNGSQSPDAVASPSSQRRKLQPRSPRKELDTALEEEEEVMDLDGRDAIRKKESLLDILSGPPPPSWGSELPEAPPVPAIRTPRSPAPPPSARKSSIGSSTIAGAARDADASRTDVSSISPSENLSRVSEDLNAFPFPPRRKPPPSVDENPSYQGSSAGTDGQLSDSKTSSHAPTASASIIEANNVSFDAGPPPAQSTRRFRPKDERDLRTSTKDLADFFANGPTPPSPSLNGSTRTDTPLLNHANGDATGNKKKAGRFKNIMSRITGSSVAQQKEGDSMNERGRYAIASLNRRPNSRGGTDGKDRKALNPLATRSAVSLGNVDKDRFTFADVREPMPSRGTLHPPSSDNGVGSPEASPKDYVVPPSLRSAPAQEAPWSGPEAWKHPVPSLPTAEVQSHEKASSSQSPIINTPRLQAADVSAAQSFMTAHTPPTDSSLFTSSEGARSSIDSQPQADSEDETQPSTGGKSDDGAESDLVQPSGLVSGVSSTVAGLFVNDRTPRPAAIARIDSENEGAQEFIESKRMSSATLQASPGTRRGSFTDSGVETVPGPAFTDRGVDPDPGPSYTDSGVGPEPTPKYTEASVETTPAALTDTAVATTSPSPLLDAQTETSYTPLLVDNGCETQAVEAVPSVADLGRPQDAISLLRQIQVAMGGLTAEGCRSIVDSLLSELTGQSTSPANDSFPGAVTGVQSSGSESKAKSVLGEEGLALSMTPEESIVEWFLGGGASPADDPKDMSLNSETTKPLSTFANPTSSQMGIFEEEKSASDNLEHAVGRSVVQDTPKIAGQGDSVSDPEADGVSSQ